MAKNWKTVKRQFNATQIPLKKTNANILEYCKRLIKVGELKKCDAFDFKKHFRDGALVK